MRLRRTFFAKAELARIAFPVGSSSSFEWENCGGLPDGLPLSRPLHVQLWLSRNENGVVHTGLAWPRADRPTCFPIPPSVRPALAASQIGLMQSCGVAITGSDHRWFHPDNEVGLLHRNGTCKLHCSAAICGNRESTITLFGSRIGRNR